MKMTIGLRKCQASSFSCAWRFPGQATSVTRLSRSRISTSARVARRLILPALLGANPLHRHRLPAPDHLGCYGYHRATSPHIDAIARQAFASTTSTSPTPPACPAARRCSAGGSAFTPAWSTTAARGAMSHEGPERGFCRLLGAPCPGARPARPRAPHRDGQLRSPSATPPTSSTPASTRCRNPGRRGLETATRSSALASDWLDRNGAHDQWFLHVQLWDPHTPYRDAATCRRSVRALTPLPAWLTERCAPAHLAGSAPTRPGR